MLQCMGIVLVSRGALAIGEEPCRIRDFHVQNQILESAKCAGIQGNHGGLVGALLLLLLGCRSSLVSV